MQWEIDKPNDLTDIEEFFWTIKGLSKFNRNRLTDFIPKTWNPFIEKETKIDNMIEKNR